MLTPQKIREFIQDKVEKNFLLDDNEFSLAQISVAMDMTLSDWNSTPPTAADNLNNFPYDHIMMSGTLYRCFMGQAALLARNTFEFSDGGISIPLEERFQLYQALSGMFQAEYNSTMTKVKINQNMDQGWGSMGSDYARFPIW